MLMWRSPPDGSLLIALSIAAVQVVVISVGRLRPPYADDVAHYERLLGRYVRLSQIELRDAPARPSGSARGCRRARTCRCSPPTASSSTAPASRASSRRGGHPDATSRSS